MGKVNLEVEARILEPDHQSWRKTIVKWPLVMKGYCRNEQATRMAFSSNGCLGSKNCLYLTGRKKSMIVTKVGKKCTRKRSRTASSAT